MVKKYTILIVDDKVENLKYLNTILKEENYEIKATIDAHFAIDSVIKNPVDLILLDIKMPELNGFEVCKIIKEKENLKDIPIIFISALDDVNSKVEAFEKGGVDYITKPFEEKEIKKQVDNSQLEVKELEFYVNVIVLFSIIIFLMSFFTILIRIVYPIDLLRVAMLKLSSNKMDVQLDKNKYQDEVGDMIGSVAIFKENTQKLISSEEQLKLAIDDARNANKAKSIFLARMSHELRTPLNAILGFSNLLSKSNNINTNEKENLHTIKKSANYLLNIINEILELSKNRSRKNRSTSKNI